jgi:ABC-type multidrug transport system fused ATPase/permease subunit
LSGGQAQRIAICRGLVRNPDIFLLDEITSALDGHTESVVVEALLKSEESARATKIVVAHKLSTIRTADRIYVMADGRVCEVGTYGQLLNLGGIFTAMAKKQAGS